MTAATSTSPPRSARNTGLLGPALALTAALCLTPLAGCGAGAGGTAAGDWNLLFVTFDTTRADALSCYGHEDAKTPTLDALAAEGFLFEQAFATVPITLPSHSSLFTGTYPMAHGVRENGSFRLAESRTTLAEVLGGAGFATGAAVGSFPLTRGFGIEQGFGFFDDNITAARRNIEGKVTSDIDSLYFDERPSQHVNDAILPFLEKQAGGRFFAWLHYWDPHQPLIPAPPFDQLFAHDLYQGEIAQADQSLGQILAELERLGVLEKTLIVMAGDHGEGHGEHGEDSHSLLAYNSTLHVPLIVKIPGREGGVRIADRVSTIDVMPTLLELLGLEAPPTMQGESLLPLIESGRREGRERPIYAETLSPRLSHGWGEQRAVFYGDQKYIHGPRSELYNLRLDPRELDDLAPQKPEDASEMKRLLEGLLKRYSVADAADSVQEVDSATRQRLAALGYLSVSGGSQAVVEELRTDGIAPQDRIRDVTLSSRTKQAIDRQQYLQAREMALDLVQRDPTSSYYRGLLALAYFGLGQLDQAAQLAETAQSSLAANDSVFMLVAQRLFNGGQRERALKLMEKLVGSHPTAEGHYLLAEMHGVLGSPVPKLEELEKAVALESSHDRALLSLAIYHGQLGEVERSEELLRSLLGYHPFHAKGHFNLAVLGLKRLDFVAARHLLERAVELDPGYCQAHVALLALDVEEKKTGQAEDRYQGILNRCTQAPFAEQARSLMG